MSDGLTIITVDSLTYTHTCNYTHTHNHTHTERGGGLGGDRERERETSLPQNTSQCRELTANLPFFTK